MREGRKAALAGAATMVALAAPASANAATYRFRVDFTVVQHAGWQYTFRDNICKDDSAADYYEHSGTAHNHLKSTLRGGRLTFRTGPMLQSGELRTPAFHMGDDFEWSVVYRDDPNSDCLPSPNLGTPQRGIHCDGDWIRGVLRTHFLVIKGRLMPTGGFYTKPAGVFLCPDATAVTGAIAAAGPSTRRGVDKLITNRRVRTIKLGAGPKRVALGASKLTLPGPNFDVLSGVGGYNAKWSIKLVRLR